jgi:uncharacterized peroxidase-related enzyme
MGEDTVARAIAADPDGADLGEGDRAMLDYSLRLTRDPSSVRVEDVARLRDVGFDDTAILDICQVVSYYNYVNRLADGLGVELEEGWEEDRLVLSREEFRGRQPRAGKKKS